MGHVLGKSHDDHMIYIVPKGHFASKAPIYYINKYKVQFKIR